MCRISSGTLTRSTRDSESNSSLAPQANAGRWNRSTIVRARVVAGTVRPMYGTAVTPSGGAKPGGGRANRQKKSRVFTSSGRPGAITCRPKVAEWAQPCRSSAE